MTSRDPRTPTLSLSTLTLSVASAFRRKLRALFGGRYNQCFQPVGFSPTGTSFNGRTPRSGRGYWGSNPYVPASLRSPFGRATARSACCARRRTDSELSFRRRLSRRSSAKPSEVGPQSLRGRRTRSDLTDTRRLSRQSPRSGRRRTSVSEYLYSIEERNIRVLRDRFHAPASEFLIVLAGPKDATAIQMQGIGARFVYVLRSDSDPSRHYVGRATDVNERLEWHNAGPCGYTLRHRPWSIVVSAEFPDERAAAHFERYLKSGSGRAFAKRHFAPASDHDPDRSSNLW